jgi:hypothetical protein
MSPSDSHHPVCNVCRQQLGPTESYLVRFRHGRTTAVHRHVCFPPSAARKAEATVPARVP